MISLFKKLLANSDASNAGASNSPAGSSLLLPNKVYRPGPFLGDKEINAHGTDPLWTIAEIRKAGGL